ncbi:hypothetical protein NUBL21995_23340 [Klebsiella pneumoniae]|nr:hypothetical protein NUBL21995_23340 [Klebsiella pneumoniae]
MFAGKKSAQIREILISESAWEEMTCLFAPSLTDRNNTPVTLDKPFDPNVDPSITVNADGTGTFNLKAYYYTWDKDNAEAGDGNATARFTIMQE